MITVVQKQSSFPSGADSTLVCCVKAAPKGGIGWPTTMTNHSLKRSRRLRERRRYSNKRTWIQQATTRFILLGIGLFATALDRSMNYGRWNSDKERSSRVPYSALVSIWGGACIRNLSLIRNFNMLVSNKVRLSLLQKRLHLFAQQRSFHFASHLLSLEVTAVLHITRTVASLPFQKKQPQYEHASFKHLSIFLAFISPFHQSIHYGVQRRRIWRWRIQ